MTYIKICYILTLVNHKSNLLIDIIPDNPKNVNTSRKIRRNKAIRKRFVMTDKGRKKSFVVCKTDSTKELVKSAREFIQQTGGQCKLLVEEISNGEYLKTDMFDEAIDKLMTAYQWANLERS